jgi:hypothetical protein
MLLSQSITHTNCHNVVQFKHSHTMSVILLWLYMVQMHQATWHAPSYFKHTHKINTQTTPSKQAACFMDTNQHSIKHTQCNLVDAMQPASNDTNLFLEETHTRLSKSTEGEARRRKQLRHHHLGITIKLRVCLAGLWLLRKWLRLWLL